MAPARASGRVCLGAIAGVHGVRGVVRIKSFAARPENLFAYGPLSDEAGERKFELVPAGQAKGVVLARIAGVGDRAAAAALKGTRLYVERAALPEPAADEFYHADLVGLRVEDRAGTALGEVTAVHDFGAGPILEVAAPQVAGPEVAGPEDAGKGPALLLPFTRAVAVEVDLAGGRIVAVPPVEMAQDDEEEERP